MIFATFSKWTASVDEIELSKTLQTAFANFVKDPSAPPAPNWSAYNADASVPTLAKLAYHANVEPDNLVDIVNPTTTVSVGNIYCKAWLIHQRSFREQDGPCQEWAQFLDFRP